MPRPETCAQLGYRLGGNKKGVRPAVLCRWSLARERAVLAWSLNSFNCAAAGRELGCSRQNVWRLVEKYTRDLALQADALAELDEKLARQRGRRAYRARARREEKAYAKTVVDDGELR